MILAIQTGAAWRLMKLSRGEWSSATRIVKIFRVAPSREQVRRSTLVIAVLAQPIAPQARRWTMI